MKLAWRLALRDLRGGIRGMGIVLACLALGVAAIAAVGSLNEAVDRGLQIQGRVLLGGDLAIDGGAQPLPDALRTWLAARGTRISAIVTMRSLLVAPSGDRQLIDLKAVDAAYPLAGAVVLDPALPPGKRVGRRDCRRSAGAATAGLEIRCAGAHRQCLARTAGSFGLRARPPSRRGIAGAARADRCRQPCGHRPGPAWFAAGL